MTNRIIIASALLFFGSVQAANTVKFDVSGRLLPATCQFQSTGMDIPLNEVDAAIFTGLGSASPWVAGKLVSKGCDAELTWVNMTFQAEPDPNNTNFFKVTGGAEGVAVQLQSATGQQAIPDNKTEMRWAPQAAGGSYDFRARYIQTQDKVKGGSGETSAIINLTYM